MKRCDKIYLSRFAVDPDPDEVWFEDFDISQDPENDKHTYDILIGEDAFFDIGTI
jgi:hypothetical protein